MIHFPRQFEKRSSGPTALASATAASSLAKSQMPCVRDGYVPSRKLTYPTSRKGTSSTQKNPLEWQYVSFFKEGRTRAGQGAFQEKGVES